MFKAVFNDLIIYESYSKKAVIEVVEKIESGSLYDAIYSVVKREMEVEYANQMIDYEIRFKKERERLERYIVEKDNDNKKLLDQLECLSARYTDYQEFIFSNFDIKLDIFSKELMVSAFSNLKVRQKYRSQVRQKYSNNLASGELDEFLKMLEYFSLKGFHSSAELSECIVKDNSLKERFPNLTGVMQMRNDFDVWNFNGAISPKIYNFICNELKLKNNGSEATPTGFQSYNHLNGFLDLY